MLVPTKPEAPRLVLAGPHADVMNRWCLYEQMAAMPGAAVETQATEGSK